MLCSIHEQSTPCAQCARTASGSTRDLATDVDAMHAEIARLRLENTAIRAEIEARTERRTSRRTHKPWSTTHEDSPNGARLVVLDLMRAPTHFPHPDCACGDCRGIYFVSRRDTSRSRRSLRRAMLHAHDQHQANRYRSGSIA